MVAEVQSGNDPLVYDEKGVGIGLGVTSQELGSFRGQRATTGKGET